MISEHMKGILEIFCKTTTLHGFKYLWSSNRWDRAGWLLCCALSACCAGVLCSVLWARFLDVPVLLSLKDPQLESMNPLPLFAVCIAPEKVAELMLYYLTNDTHITQRLYPSTFLAFAGKTAHEENFTEIEQLLNSHNESLHEIMIKITPPCEEITIKCRIDYEMLPCKQLFQKEIVVQDVCCVMRQSRIPSKMSAVAMSYRKIMDVALQCGDDKTIYGCRVFTEYADEDSVHPTVVTPGLVYIMKLTFTSVQDISASDNILNKYCVTKEDYSFRQCLIECAERVCGCTVPLNQSRAGPVLPVCSFSSFYCLRVTYEYENDSCSCLPSCRQITTQLYVTNGPLDASEHSLDPMIKGLKDHPSRLYLRMRIALTASKVHLRFPTETWFTLLADLGGVFSMFLGVGFLSTLELLFFVVVKCPAFTKN